MIAMLFIANNVGEIRYSVRKQILQLLQYTDYTTCTTTTTTCTTSTTTTTTTLLLLLNYYRFSIEFPNHLSLRPELPQVQCTVLGQKKMKGAHLTTFFSAILLSLSYFIKNPPTYFFFPALFPKILSP